MKRTLAGAILAVIVLVSAVPASGAIVKNGGFETGTPKGWKRTQEGGGAWDVFPNASTLCFYSIPSIGGDFLAATDQAIESAEVLYQDLRLPDARRLKLTMKVAYYTAGPFVTANTLHSDVPNKQLRIDILRAGADPYTLKKSKVLKQVFRTTGSSPLTQAPQKQAADLPKLRGQKVRLRIAVAANPPCLIGVVDDVKVRKG